MVVTTLSLYGCDADEKKPHATTAVQLFTDLIPQQASSSFTNEVVVRHRFVNINSEFLLNKDIATGQTQKQSASDLIADAEQTILINLFDDVSAETSQEKIYKNASGSFTWVGKVDNLPQSTAIFIINADDKVYGMVDLPSLGNFSIRPLLDGRHIIEQVDNSGTLSGESDFRIPDSSGLANRADKLVARSVEISNDDGSIIDVYVAYDQDASGGSVAAVDAQAYAELFIAYTNQAYENSGINQRVWLVGNVDGYNYTDPYINSQDSDLDALTNTNDGLIDGIHAKRDEYHADLVVFLTPSSGSFCGGKAWLQTTNNDVGFNTYGFSTMNACSFGSNIFAHELGHNMGSRHDWYVDDGQTPSTVAHGYIDTTNGFRTIMSYGNRCAALGISCPTISHFSNPSIDHDSHSTGVAANTSSGCSALNANPDTECDADNASNFNNKALNTSRFRDSRLTWTGAVNSNWSVAGNWVINEGAPGSTIPVSRVPRAYDNVYIPGELNTYPIVSGIAAARELTIATGASLSMTSGSLTVGWSWEDNGGFNATGGEVIFNGPVGIGITSSSSFQDIQIGDGFTASKVTLEKNIDIDGDLLINAGSILSADNYTINLAGDWTESDATGFNAGIGLVILDGSNQSLSKTTNVTLLNESFTAYDSSCCTSVKPSGWANSGGSYYQGDLITNNNGAANRWRNQSDGYLYTPALSLQAGVTYQLQYSVSTRQNYSDGDSTLSPQTVSVHLGSSQSPSSMTAGLLLDGETSETSTSYQVRTVGSITVGSSGDYYIGFRAQQSGDDYTSFDAISLTGVSSLSFNNLQVVSGISTFNTNVNVAGDLQVNSGATATFSPHTLTVLGNTIEAGNGIAKAIPVILDMLMD